jgi:hypothetical protein
MTTHARNWVAALAVFAISMVFTGCGDPTFDPDAPLEFAADGSVGAVAFCAPFSATTIRVEARPDDNSTDSEVLLELSGELTFEVGNIVRFDDLPSGAEGMTTHSLPKAPFTVYLIAVAADSTEDNLNAQFEVSPKLVEDGSWVNGRGDVSALPCSQN